MPSGCEKAFCILRFNEAKSATAVQRTFRTEFHKDPPSRNAIYSWYTRFETTGHVCKGKPPGSPLSRETVERVRQSFVQNPQKSTVRGSRELRLSQSTVWRIVRKSLLMRNYKLQLATFTRSDVCLHAEALPVLLRFPAEDRR
jgi:hypothetical protein